MVFIRVFFASVLLMCASFNAFGGEVKACFLKGYKKLKPIRIDMMVNTALVGHEDPSDELKKAVFQYVNVSEEILEIEYKYWIEKAEETNVVGMSQPFWVRELSVPYFTDQEISLIEGIDEEYSRLLDRVDEFYLNAQLVVKKEKGTRSLENVKAELREGMKEFNQQGRALAKKCYELSNKS